MVWGDGDMRKRRSFLERLGEKLDIPQEALPGGFSVTLSGRGCVRVHGCVRVLSYEEERICLELCGSVLIISGERLIFTSFSGGELEISGVVYALAFEEACE